MTSENNDSLTTDCHVFLQLVYQMLKDSTVKIAGVAASSAVVVGGVALAGRVRQGVLLPP